VALPLSVEKQKDVNTSDHMPFSNGNGLMENLKLPFNEPLLTTAAVAKWLGISTRAVCLWAECKELPAIKLGRQWRFRRDELTEWLLRTNVDKVKNYTGNRRAAAGA